MADNAERELICQELVELVTSYFEDALPTEERQRLERHLAICSGCRAYLEQMRITLRLLGTLPTEDIPTALQQDLLAAFRGLRNDDERQ